MHIYRLIPSLIGKYIQRGFLKSNSAACAKDAKPLLASCVMRRGCSANKDDQFLPYRCMVPVQPGPNRCRHHHSHYRKVLYRVARCTFLFSNDHHYLFYPYWIQPAIRNMARRLLPSHSVALGLSVFLFTFAFLPTLVVLLAVIVFFVFFYPRLRK